MKYTIKFHVDRRTDLGEYLETTDESARFDAISRDDAINQLLDRYSPLPHSVHIDKVTADEPVKQDVYMAEFTAEDIAIFTAMGRTGKRMLGHSCIESCGSTAKYGHAMRNKPYWWSWADCVRSRICNVHSLFKQLNPTEVY